LAAIIFVVVGRVVVVVVVAVVKDLVRYNIFNVENEE